VIVARILVVDDEPDVRELFNITLKMAGHTTETAKDGLEAWERLQTGENMPELLLLDLMMPRLDGFGLLTRIREGMDTKPIRVLVATAKVLEDADNQRLGSWPVVGVLNKGELDISAMVTIISTALSKEPLKPKSDGDAPKEEAKPAAEGSKPGEQAASTPGTEAKPASPTPSATAPSTGTPAPSLPASSPATSTPAASTPATATPAPLPVTEPLKEPGSASATGTPTPESKPAESTTAPPQPPASGSPATEKQEEKK
jgi:CheY-like chemotaxis protein